MYRLTVLLLLVSTIAACTPAASPPTETPPPVTAAAAQTCPQLVTTALENLDRLCDGTGRNQVCYGNTRIELQPRANAVPRTFSAPGDTVNLVDIARISLSPLNLEVGEWGFALMKAQANLPDTLPGQNVTFLLFGGTMLAPQENMNGLQAFTLQSGIGAGATCAEVPSDGVLIQTPGEDVTVQFALNGVEIELGSTAYVQAEAGAALWLSVIEGQAAVTSQGVTEAVPAGTRTTVPLDANGSAAGIPAPAEPYGEDEVRALPIQPLERPIRIAPPLPVADRADFVPVGFTITDAISQGGEVDTYKFTARAGQTIFLDGQRSDTSGSIVMNLTAPDGSYVARTLWVGSDSGTLRLPQDGDYTLTVTSINATATGDYVIQIWDVPPPDVAETRIGATLTGSIETPGVSDVYTFTGREGQTIFLDGQRSDTSGSIVMNLTAPDGTELARTLWVGSDSGTLDLTQSGTYTLTVNAGNNSATGDYIIQIWDVPPPDVAETRIGATLTGSIETPGVRDIYTFTGREGQTIFLDGQRSDTSGSIVMNLTAPDGSEVVRTLWVGSDSGTVYLQQSGIYTLTINGNGSSATGGYAIQLWNVPDIVYTDLTLTALVRGGSARSAVAQGEITVPGEMHGYNFEASAGQTLTLTGQDRRSPGDILLLLRAPDGTEIVSSGWVGRQYDPLPLDQTGGYELLIYSGHSGATGTYALEIRVEGGR